MALVFTVAGCDYFQTGHIGGVFASREEAEAWSREHGDPKTDSVHEWRVGAERTSLSEMDGLMEGYRVTYNYLLTQVPQEVSTESQRVLVAAVKGEPYTPRDFHVPGVDEVEPARFSD